MMKDFHAAPRLCRVFALWSLIVGVLTLAPSRLPGATTPAAAPGWMWVWAADGAKAPETVFFRQRFRLPAAPVSARLLITADDSFAAWFNESKKPIAQGNDWTTVQEFDVTRLLRVGNNLLAIEVRNNSGPGGLLYKLVVRLPGNRIQTIVSDGRVRAQRHAPPVWTAFATEDAKWPTARALAPANGGVWGPLHGALMPDAAQLVRLWNIRAGGQAGEDPYTRARNPGDRMILSAGVASASDMQLMGSMGFTLFQSDSDHLSTEETAPGQWDWRTPEAARQQTRKLGLDWGYFPHEAFPPAWFRKSTPFTRLQCLEHNQPVEGFSLWDGGWPAFIEKGYDALARQFAPPANGKAADRRLAAITVGIHGDYGEAGLLTGGRVTVPGQREDWERHFGNAHDHLGYWCADPLARADFRAAMLKKYGSLSLLNAAWKRDFKRPDDVTYPAAPRGEAKQEWLDFIGWYQGAVGNAVELNLGAARKHFPDTLLMLPCGFADEDPRGGNDNSLLAKLAAKYNAVVRSTHGAYKAFADNAATMFGRLGSAARFYNAPFWSESSVHLTPDQEVARIFEDVSQGAAGHFDLADNFRACRDVYARYGKYLRVEKPVVDVAMFYPAEAQTLHTDQGYNPRFARDCARMRDLANFDIVDDRMVRDGCLSRYRLLILWEGTQANAATLDKIKAWVNDGGTVLAYDFGKVTTFDGDLTWYNDLFGYIQGLQPAQLKVNYVGSVPAQYQINVGSAASADFLDDSWYEAQTENGVKSRWTRAANSLYLPVNPEKQYVLVVHAFVPPGAANLKRQVLVNGREVGKIEMAGDVTYRYIVPPEVLEDHPLSTLTFQSETFQPAVLDPTATDRRSLGVRIQTVQLVEQDTPEAPSLAPPPGSVRLELDLRRLYDLTSDQSWARRYGKGLTVYFPANRRQLRSYFEVARRLIYHLSAIDPERRDALPIDDAPDGVYATLFTDKILYYNATDSTVTRKVTIPAAAFVSWRGEVAVPNRNSWELTLEPHSLGAVYFATEPQELLYECEDFTELGGAKPLASADCSPGKGLTCVPLRAGASIATRFAIDAPGRYALYTRCVRNGVPQAVDVLIDGQALPPLNARAGQTMLSAAVSLARGTHTLTLRNRAALDLRADFVLFTNDATIGGYDFACAPRLWSEDPDRCANLTPRPPSLKRSFLTGKGERRLTPSPL